MPRSTWQTSTSGRPGFTLVEVCVTIGILGLLLAILLPAVQSVRAASRLTRCKNKLHQIGVALHAFHDSRGQLPTWNDPMHKILRELGYPNYAPLPNFGGQGPEVLVCPDDPLAVTTPPRVSYLLNDGSQILPRNGFFRLTGSVRWSDVTDGLSQTALCSERLVSVFPWDDWETSCPVHPLRCIWKPSHPFLPGEEEGFASYCLDESHYAADLPSRFLFQMVGAEGLYTHLIPPNRRAYWNEWEEPGGVIRMFVSAVPPTSLHAGGVHVLIADGAVDFVAETIDLTVWRALGSINGADLAGR